MLDHQPSVNTKRHDVELSVCVCTYNQEKYIKQCLQSIVNQVTDFDFEVIVGDDCSTDRTRAIITELAERYPEKIKLLLHPRNLGPALNYRATHKHASGRLIAHIDGDDLMLPGKLATQQAALTRNPDCVMVTHDVQVIDENGRLLSASFKKHKPGVNKLSDLYQSLPFFANSSKMVRADIDRASLELVNRNAIDIETHVFIAHRGNIFHIDESLGAYRTLTGMTATAQGAVNRALVDATQRIFSAALRDSKAKKEFISRCQAKALLNYAYQAAVLGNKEQVREF
jgi:glycosyltransferase involved in cell wall biosynthesis